MSDRALVCYLKVSNKRFFHIRRRQIPVCVEPEWCSDCRDKHSGGQLVCLDSKSVLRRVITEFSGYSDRLMLE